MSKLILYGSDISYFTGKMENYFRVCGISYEFRNMQFPAFKKEMEKKVGLMQMPAVVLEDGRWMTDTTKMIQWFEKETDKFKVLPKDPVQAFFCFLLEDWADEWWWRTAMHYRWHYTEGVRFAARHLASNNLKNIRLPKFFKMKYVQYRQRSGYTTGDGIRSSNVEAVESDFIKLLKNLENIFKSRNFIFGERPTLADIGFSGPFFRHFALDPVPLKIIKRNYPNVLNWVLNLWNTRLSANGGRLVEGVPTDLEPLLQDIGNIYLPYLNANVDAVSAGKKRFDVHVGGIDFKGARYSKYRVWCLKELRNHFINLPIDPRNRVEKLLKKTGCWNVLWKEKNLPLTEKQEEGLPFQANNKMVGVNEAI